MKTAFVFACVFGAALRERICINHHNLIPKEHITLTKLLPKQALNLSDYVDFLIFVLNLKDIYKACQADPATHVDHKLLLHLADNIDNPKVGAHILCESKAVGFQKPNGELDLAVIRQKVAYSFPDKAKVETLVKECAVKEKTPEKTAVNLYVCLDKYKTHLYEF